MSPAIRELAIIVDPGPPQRDLRRPPRSRSSRSGAAGSSSSPTRGTAAARRVIRLKADPGRFLAVIQIGITFVGFLASAFAAVSLVDGMRDWLSGFGDAFAGVAGVIALIVVTGLLTHLHDRLRRAGPEARSASPTRSAFAMTTSRLIDFLGASCWARSSRS